MANYDPFEQHNDEKSSSKKKNHQLHQNLLQVLDQVEHATTPQNRRLSTMHQSPTFAPLLTEHMGLDEETKFFQRIAKLLHDPKRGVELGDHNLRFYEYENCAVGYDIVQWLIDNQFIEPLKNLRTKRTAREEATAFGQRMLELGFLSSLSTDHFSDAYEMYGFDSEMGPLDTAAMQEGESHLEELNLVEIGESMSQLPAQPSRAENIPISIFITVLGTASQGLLYQRLDDSLHKMGKNGLLHNFDLLYIAKFFFTLASLFFFLCCFAYTYKIIFARKAVLKEWRDPNSRNQFGMLSMSILLLATSALRNVEILGQIGWWIGTILQSVMTIELVGHWITEGRSFEAFNPTYFLPVAGLSLVSGPAWRLGWSELAWLYLGVALVFWMLLFGMLLIRLVFFPPMPPALTPTLFMAFATPSLLYNAYVVIGGQGSLDNFGRVLFACALFTVIIVFRIRLVIKGMGFSLTWFAYTFPLNGFATAVVSYHEQIQSKVTMVLCLVATFLSFLFWLSVTLAGCYWLLSGHITKLLNKRKNKRN